MKFSTLTLCLMFTLPSTSSFTKASQIIEKTKELPRSEIFPPEDGKLPPLQGKITKGRYLAPEKIFSCKADDFGEGSYIAQDGLLEQAVCVAFYSPTSDFTKAEIMFMPWLENINLDKKALKDFFEGFGIGVLTKVDNAIGIESLSEEMIDDMFFTTVSIRKMSVLRTEDGRYMSSTRGYLIFSDKDKLVILSNQICTLPGQKHTPFLYRKKLRQRILDFRKTFKFGSIPMEKNNEESISQSNL